jgi:hypothetical protein
MSDNDFTPEELQDIANALESWVPDHIGLRLKVHQMIENYCDHDFQNTYNEREVWLCAHCGIE